ncbi:hypothetical protein HispidOSU_009803 [Sigmodon hispidus]
MLPPVRAGSAARERPSSRCSPQNESSLFLQWEPSVVNVDHFCRSRNKGAPWDEMVSGQNAKRV